ncbi:MAG: trypsin-like peptidase domain-containing protein [Clostridiales bacterium]|nr:trypsin-like peptidase domain-containing protein [Clostridiales bacterium]
MENNYYQQNNVNEPVNNEPVTIHTPPKKGSSTNAAKIVALVLCCSIAGGITGAGSMYLIDTVKDVSLNGINAITSSSSDSGTILMGQREAKALNMSYVNTDKEMTASEIYAANVNSTVGITTSIMTNFFGYQTTSAAAGSGFILSDDGYIITNYHVVEDAEDIKVTTYDNEEYNAKLIGYDEDNDIAVLKIDAKGLTPVIIGDSDNMNVGDSVVAIGNPLGELTFSLTQGAVSALNRTITFGSTSMNLIQTDCAINSGNSGGALFNSHGEVIGITNAKYSGDSSTASIDNIGFAIPINSVSDIINSIVENGYVVKPYIGVQVFDLEGYRQILEGAVVYSVEEGSPADKAGLQRNDVITKVNGEDITGQSDLRSALAKGKEGDVFTLTIYRDGDTIEVQVTPASRKVSANRGTEQT